MGFDAAIVGSGVNGLAAAVVLARAGLSVVVYEAKDTIGGGTRTAELTLPGFRHDICSAIHPMGLGSPFLRTLDLAAHGLTWVHPDVLMAHPYGDGVALLEREPESPSLGPDAKRWAALVGPYVAHWDGFSADTLGPIARPPAHPMLMTRFGLHGALPATWLGKALFSGPGRALLYGLAAHSFLPLDALLSSSFAMMLGVCGHAVGWPMPRGGASALPDALASLFRSLGGTIRTGTPIRSIGDVETTGPVLFEVAPKNLVAICGDALPSGYANRLLRFRNGPGVFKLDWALDGPVPWADERVARAGVVHLGTMDEIVASEKASNEGRITERPFVLLAQHTLFDPTRAPPGKHTCWAYCHVPSGSTVDRTEAIEAQIERSAPGFRERILAKHAMNSVDFEAYNANYIGGEPTGGRNDVWHLFTRPVASISPYATPNPRVFLCSASTPPGGGIHGMCGFHAAKAVLSGLGVSRAAPSR